jgi:hypothetical protein
VRGQSDRRCNSERLEPARTPWSLKFSGEVNAGASIRFLLGCGSRLWTSSEGFTGSYRERFAGSR